jgi:DNA-directed RNA polymerase beta' subunit
MKALQFYVPDAIEVRRRSVTLVDHTATFKCGQAVENGLFDLYMGALGDHKCKTCGLNATECTGHFGHLELAEPQYNPILLAYILKQVREHCSCGKKRSGRICSICFSEQGTASSSATCCGKKKWSRKICPHCREAYPAFTVDNGSILCNGKEFRTEAFCALQDTCNAFVLKALPVPPMCMRPSIVTVQNTIRSHDNLTIHLLEIIKKNNALAKALKERQMGHFVKQCRCALREQISMYMSNGGARDAFKKNAGSVAGIMDRLGGKIGRFRKNLMGKRCNFTARTVVGGDPSLGIEELGVPRSVARTLTKRIRVCDFNIDALSRRGVVNRVYRGACIAGRFVAEGAVPFLQVGDAVDRYIRDGDWVLFNRQPSLHKMSLMAHRVRILPYSTFRLNLSVTTPYNADFDGDEMNMHVPQTPEATAELATLCRVREQIVSVTNNKPVIGIVQDTLLGSYLCTSQNILFTEDDAMRHFMALERPEEALKRAREHRDSDPKANESEGGTPYYTGAHLLSVLLPQNLTVRIGDTYILNGRSIEGVWNKRVLGTSGGSLPHILFLDHGAAAAQEFLDGLQRIVCSIMKTVAFTAGFKDCILPKEALEKVKATKAATQKKYNALPDGNEEMANVILNAARDTIGRLAVENCSSGNNFFTMKNAGSKGSNINMAQIMGCVGQQNVQGKRIGWDSKRTLPHFPEGSTDPASKGYIARSYIEGLNPQQFFFHTQAGREGLVDTAVKTAQTGYLQRRIVKGMEDVVVEYDGTCRDREKVLQFEYGEDGYSAVYVEWQHVPCLRLTEMAFERMYRFPDNREEMVAIGEARDLFEYADSARGSNYQFETRFVLPCNVDRFARQCGDSGTVLHRNDVVLGYELRNIHKYWADVHAPPLVRAFLTSTLSSKRIVEHYKLSKQALETLAEGVVAKLRKARITPKESVGALAAQSIGEPSTQLTLNSVDYETRLIIRWKQYDHGVRNGNVGELVDSLLAIYKDNVQVNEETSYLPIPAGMAEALTVDESGTVSWKALEAVTRHPPQNSDGTTNLVKITTQSGRTVSATRAKSFLVLHKGNVVVKKGSDLRVGDCVPVVCQARQTLKSLDLRNYLCCDTVFFTSHFKGKRPFRRKREAIKVLKHKVFLTKNKVIARPFGKRSVAISDRIRLTESFGYFLGAYLSGGTCVGQWIHIVHAPPYCEKAGIWLNKQGLALVKTDAPSGIKTKCSVLQKLLFAWCGTDKVVPAFVHCGPKPFMNAVLYMLLQCGTAVGSRSKTLIEGVHLLCTCLGKAATQRMWSVEGSPLYGLRIHHTGKKARKRRKCSIESDPIVKIECCGSTHEYVYDLTVADTRNMVTASGLAVRDTFHNSGVSSKTNVTLGVPRLNELINCSKTIKTPSMKLFFPQGTTFEQAMQSKHKLVPTKLKTITTGYEIAYKHDLEFPLHEDFPDPNVGQWSSLSLQLRFDRDACIRGHLHMAQLADVIYKFLPKCHLQYAEDSDLQYAIDVHVLHKGDASEPCEHLWSDPDYATLHKHSMRLQNVCCVGGVPGIQYGHLSQETRKKYHNHMLHTESEWVLTTQGTCLGNVIARHGTLDGKRCYSNHIHDVFDTLGIEAARRTLLNEIRGILSFDGSYVNARHMGLAVDWMTYNGTLSAFTRYGMAKMSDSVLKLSSFERPKHFLSQAAARSSSDTFGGVSEQLVMGMRPTFGTGSIDCRVDEEKAKGFFVRPEPKSEMELPFNLPEWPGEDFPPPPPFAPPSPLYTPFSPAYSTGSPEEGYAPTSPEEGYAPTSP